MAQQHGLGRGLASLIPKKQTSPSKDRFTEVPSTPSVAVSFQKERGGVLEVSVAAIIPNPHQPRVRFDETKIVELGESIREHGIIQPLIVTQIGENRYELIAGERRYQAAKSIGLQTVPVIVREAKEQEKFEWAIIENVQRHDLNPVEEAKAYRRLLDEFGLSQEEVAKKMGKSRSSIANIVRLLQLPVEVQRALIEGRISEGHAKALLSLDSTEQQRALFAAIIKDGLTVRETESRVKEVSVHAQKRVIDRDPTVTEKENRLAEILGTKVKISTTGKGGKIVIEYYGEEDLAHLMSRLLV